MQKKRPIYSIVVGKKVNDELLMLQYNALIKANTTGLHKVAINMPIGDIINEPKALFKNLEYVIKKFNINPTNCIFSVSSDNYFDKHELKAIKAFSALLDIKYKNPINIFSYGKYFDLQQVENACEQIYNFNETCKKADLSPLEALFYAYYMATKRQYKEEEKGDDIAWSRSIYGVLNSNKNVCVGYTEMLVNNTKIYDKNITFYGNTITHKMFRAEIPHRTLVVHIKDEKYNIDGYYFLDPTKDKTKNGEVNLNFFMLPLSDLKLARFKYHPIKLSVAKDPKAKKAKAGKSYDGGRTLISFSSENFQTLNDAHFSWFCTENKKCDENFNALTELKQDLNHEDIESYMIENSKAIPYKTMQELMYTTLKNVYKDKDASIIWDLTEKVMYLNTKRSKFFFVRSPETVNAFASQEYLESEHAKSNEGCKEQ